ncbi:TetR/AcrR family transcriptional regulator [Streptomyces caeni]|uniref:TetR/AcrR family transcriptional regulator n=1 Tax=Streptomyces caeni TaxID=2307231 RepID=A0ABW4IX06_9ACTN
MSKEPAPPKRRTQQERKQSTIARLIDSTIDSIAEVGYANTSVGEICRRSGVSRGGLFRHFDSRLSLVVAAAEEVAVQHLAVVRRRLAQEPDRDLRETLLLMRERHRHEANVVWFELLVAARTDPDLRKQLTPVAEQFFETITKVARDVPALRGLSDEDRHLLVSTVRNLFDGEVISRSVVPEPAVEAERLDLLAEFAEFLVTRRTRVAATERS